MSGASSETMQAELDEVVGLEHAGITGREAVRHLPADLIERGPDVLVVLDGSKASGRLSRRSSARSLCSVRTWARNETLTIVIL